MESQRLALLLIFGISIFILFIGAIVMNILYPNDRYDPSHGINGIDQSIKNEINKLFAEDSSRKVVVYPATRLIKIPRGEDSSGFGFSIRNINEDEGSFSYEISAKEIGLCDINLSTADSLIPLGKKRINIVLPPGMMMDDPLFVRFDIPETAPLCDIRYSIEVYEGNKLYEGPINVDLRIVPE
ncbi:MAG: hypothetical protein ABH804_00190 [archaeon]